MEQPAGHEPSGTVLETCKSQRPSRSVSAFLWTERMRHSEIFAACLFLTSSPLFNLDLWTILRHFTDCSQPSSRDPPFTPRPVSDPTAPDIVRTWPYTTSSSLYFGFGGCAEGLGTNGVDEIVLVDFDDADEVARQFNPKLTRTSNRGRLNTHQTRPPLRLDLVALKSIFSCDSASDHFQHVLSLRGSGQLDDCWPLDEDVPRHPTRHALSSPTPSTVLTHPPQPSQCLRLLLNDPHSFVTVNNWLEASLAERDQPAIWTKTIEFEGEESILLQVCADLSETDQSMLTIDNIILASEYSPDRNFVFTTPFSFTTSAFTRTPIGVAACTVVVEDGIVTMGGLSGTRGRVSNGHPLVINQLFKLSFKRLTNHNSLPQSSCHSPEWTKQHNPLFMLGHSQCHPLLMSSSADVTLCRCHPLLMSSSADVTLCRCHPLPMSPFAEEADIHTCLVTSIILSVQLATPIGLERLGIKDRGEQQTIPETVFQHVLIPSEKYICHLLVNRFSIIDGKQSSGFLLLLTYLLELSPYYQPTMDFVLFMPVFLTIPSCLIFFENENSNRSFLYEMIHTQRRWTDEGGEVRKKGKEVHRMLRMEGINDVNEAKLQNDKGGYDGDLIVINSIRRSNLLGMNLPEHE
ncbi:hypothetical protein BLNAU_16360 [Blattamonas nauphoetae]|uniref:Uncharacterized protein n=1 Tax=Blattamonas nauphoetae TaxID=2049346 RepID=A0ABQ9XBR0_9EUKA|nr:hypothetical protein BLNAU_16360 [Blattamonas nauphoetae]